MMERFYNTSSKKSIAVAYGIRKVETLTNRIESKLSHTHDDEFIKRLGVWKGNGLLLPDQVRCIVELLGTPETPSLLYTETRQ